MAEFVLRESGTEAIRRRAFSGLRAAEGAALGIGAATTVGVVASSHGGYFPTSWDWTAFVLLWIGVLALVLRSQIALGPPELALLGGMATVVAWIGLSIGWTQTVPQSVLELERALVYLAAVAAGLFVVRRRTVPQLLGGGLAAIVTISGYSLATRGRRLAREPAGPPPASSAKKFERRE